MADSDPELRRALIVSLAPWRLEVVVDPPAPTNTAQADARALANNARFVVWRRDGDLVVFDRERGAAEHREAKAGALDAPSAAAAALTVKTLMRLPPPSVEPVEAVKPVALDKPRARTELRIQTALAARLAHGSTTELGARAAISAFVRPRTVAPLRFGVVADLGTSSGVQQSGFKGRWSEWNVLAIASWTRAFDRWELEPHLGLGVTRSLLEGSEGSVSRTEANTAVVLRAGLWIRWRVGALSFGPSVELDAIPVTPTYTKTQGNGDLFAVPALAFALGGLAAVEFGR